MPLKDCLKADEPQIHHAQISFLFLPSHPENLTRELARLTSHCRLEEGNTVGTQLSCLQYLESTAPHPQQSIPWGSRAEKWRIWSPPTHVFLNHLPNSLQDYYYTGVNHPRASLSPTRCRQGHPMLHLKLNFLARWPSWGAGCQPPRWPTLYLNYIKVIDIFRTKFLSAMGPFYGRWTCVRGVYLQ